MLLQFDVAGGRSGSETACDPLPAPEPAPAAPGPWHARVKAVADFVAACCLLLPAAPLILLSALLVKLTSRGPAFYSQTRLGRGGRPFKIYKMRTMCHDCERHGGPRWSTAGDPR